MSTVEENRVRRHAKRLGLEVHKSRGKHIRFNDLMEYMITDPQLNAVIYGNSFDASLEQVEDWLQDYEKNLKEAER